MHLHTPCLSSPPWALGTLCLRGTSPVGDPPQGTWWLRTLTLSHRRSGRAVPVLVLTAMSTPGRPGDCQALFSHRHPAGKGSLSHPRWKTKTGGLPTMPQRQLREESGRSKPTPTGGGSHEQTRCAAAGAAAHVPVRGSWRGGSSPRGGTAMACPPPRRRPHRQERGMQQINAVLRGGVRGAGYSEPGASRASTPGTVLMV